MYKILNGIKFKVSEDQGETWFHADKPLHHNTLKKCIRESGYEPKWFSPKYGNFSTYSEVA